MSSNRTITSNSAHVNVWRTTFSYCNRRTGKISCLGIVTEVYLPQQDSANIFLCFRTISSNQSIDEAVPRKPSNWVGLYLCQPTIIANKESNFLILPNLICVMFGRMLGSGLKFPTKDSLECQRLTCLGSFRWRK